MSLLQRLQHRRVPRSIHQPPSGGSGTGALIPDFSVAFGSVGSEVNLHDLSIQSDGSSVYKSVIDWGDNTAADSTRCPIPTSVDPPVHFIRHSYKSSGLKTIRLTTYDASNNNATIQKSFQVTLPGAAGTPPTGRTFAGVDQFPGVDPRLLKFGQPLEYLNTTQPLEAIVNTSLVRTASTVAALNTAFNELGTSGGTIKWTGGNIDAWVMPDRPMDSNGVRYNTVIWIQSDVSVRPVGYPAPYNRITPVKGAALPAFRAINSSQPAIYIGDSLSSAQYKYNVRFTGFGITVTPTYTSIRSGGGLVTFGKLTSGIVFEQCYSYLPSEQVSQIGVRRDFSVYGGRHAWIDGWHWGNRDLNTDSQAIAGWSLNGPLKIVNCFLSGTECWMTGGAPPDDPTNPELPWRPRDLEIRMCHLWNDSARLPYNIRYYDGSGPMLSGKLLNSGIHVASWNAGTQLLTLTNPVTVPDGSFALPLAGWRVDYVIYVRSGTGAGQGALVRQFNDSTHLVLWQDSIDYRNAFTTPLDATSVIELRLKFRWITKNNGEFKECRSAYIADCVFENGGIGDDSQYNIINFKTTVSGTDDFYPYTGDISMLDCMCLNVYGGLSFSSLPRGGPDTDHGFPAQRFHFENILIIHGDPNQIGSSTGNKVRPLNLSADTIYIKGVTDIGSSLYGITQFDTSLAGNSDLGENLTIRGLITQAPTTPAQTGYWFGQTFALDITSADFTGNAVFNTSAMPAGSPGTWYTEPTATPAGVFNNPVLTDFWGAADFEVKPALTGLIAATPERLNWARLKARTNGVRAAVSDIPYQWD